ncbi:hypothetical protein ACROYT_G013792 [Oculina patagonica]
MVVVAKPQKIRICLDPKDLNRAIQRPKYQMPTMKNFYLNLAKPKSSVHSTQKNGFYQLSQDEDSSKLTTFLTPLGRYRYLRMPFRISLAPEVFESKLQECLADLPGVKVIRDDILDGLKPDPDKVTAIKNMPKPTSKFEVLTFLGFVNYLSKFLPKLSDVSAPLRELTTNQAQFTWARQHVEAFVAIQQLVIKHPVLKFYDVEDVTIQTDASNKGLTTCGLRVKNPLSDRAEICDHRERMPGNRLCL